MNADLDLLIFSLLGFLLAPFFVIYGTKKKYIYQFVDGFTISSIILITFFHLIPESIYQEGIWAFGFLILGFLFPKILHSTQKQLLVFIIFLLVHTLLESSAIGVSKTKNLAFAVVLHNLPIGIFIFSKVSKEKGVYLAFGTIVLIFIFSIAGFTLGDRMILIHRFQYHLQGFIAANVLHILFDSIHHKFIFDTPRSSSSNSIIFKYHVFSTLGAIVGIFILVYFSNELFINFSSHVSEITIFSIFLKILLETSPILLLAFFLSGILRTFLSSHTSNWLKSGNSITQALKGVVFGLPLPICSCGILPLYKTLIQTGVPATAGMAFLIATPEIGLDALLITIPLLGLDFSIYRLISAFLVAFFIAYFVGKNVPLCEVKQNTEVQKISTFSEKLKAGLKYGFLELFDHIMPWLIFGILIASLFEFLVNYEFFHQIPSYVQVPIFALLGIPTYVCATGATPFVAIAIHKGVSLGAGLAFLISGPATNITTFSVLKILHGKKTAYLFAVAILIFSMSLGFVLDSLPIDVTNKNHNFLDEKNNWLEQLSLGIILLLFLYSSLRIGPRGIIHQIDEHYHN